MPDFLNFYEILSILIHPHDVRSISTEYYLIMMTGEILLQLIKLYYNPEIDIKNSFENEVKLIYAYNIPTEDNYAYIFRNICLQQVEILNNIRDASIKVNGSDYFLNKLIITIDRMLIDINSDHIHGLCESCKVKLKVLVELFAAYCKLLLYDYYDYNQFVLFTHYTILLEKKILEVPYNMEEEYKTYKKIYPNSKISIKTFESKFLGNLGFLIDENGKCPTFSSIVKEIFDKLYKNLKLNDSEFKLKDLMFLEYYESIQMGHGCGYLYFCNTGAFQDSINVVLATDFLIYHFLYFVNFFENLNKNNRKKTYFNALRNNLKRFDDLVHKKILILKKPTISKTF